MGIYRCGGGEGADREDGGVGLETKPRRVPEEQAATPDEVRTALDRLTEAELVKLEGYAEWRVRGLGRKAAGRTEGDLLGEAVMRTLSGERRWNKSQVNLVGHLIGVMKSVSSHWRRDFDPDEEPTLESDLATKTDEGGMLRPFDLAPSAEPSADRLLEAKDLVEAIEQAFGDDPVVSLILEGIREGMSPADVRSELRLSQTEYETAMKRLRRRAAAVAAAGGRDA